MLSTAAPRGPGPPPATRAVRPGTDAGPPEATPGRVEAAGYLPQDALRERGGQWPPASVPKENPADPEATKPVPSLGTPQDRQAAPLPPGGPQLRSEWPGAVPWPAPSPPSPGRLADGAPGIWKLDSLGLHPSGSGRKGWGAWCRGTARGSPHPQLDRGPAPGRAPPTGVTSSAASPPRRKPLPEPRTCCRRRRRLDPEADVEAERSGRRRAGPGAERGGRGGRVGRVDSRRSEGIASRAVAGVGRTACFRTSPGLAVILAGRPLSLDRGICVRGTGKGSVPTRCVPSSRKRRASSQVHRTHVPSLCGPRDRRSCEHPMPGDPEAELRPRCRRWGPAADTEEAPPTHLLLCGPPGS